MHSIFSQEKPSQVPLSSQKAFITDDNIQSTFSEGESQTLSAAQPNVTDQSSSSTGPSH